ncbi:MAG: hypothetical protein J6Y02_11340 [Pseudobutyrivibrio sp.]|nr:hypothetical protein [Pseudobutyrivibrio sp.]
MKKNTKGWNLNAQYKHYLEVVNKYEMEHDVNRIHRYNKKEFRQKLNIIRETLPAGKKLNYKADIVERQVFSELSKKSAKNLVKMIKKDKSNKWTKAMRSYSAEKWGQKGIYQLSKAQKEIVSTTLDDAYWEARTKYKMSGTEAKRWVSNYYFGSPE